MSFGWKNSVLVKDAFFCGCMFTIFNGEMWTYGRTATEIKNVVDVKYNEQQPLIAFVYDNDEMSVPTLDDFINSQIDFLSKNDYVYYVAFEFCK